jgi:hypothetical protein
MDYLTTVFELKPSAALIPGFPAVGNCPVHPGSPLPAPPTKNGFEFSGAVRPSPAARFRPVQGFRYEKYVDEDSKAEIPVIMAAASRESLFPVFLQLIQQLGPVVDVVLETSHDHELAGHRDRFREQIDMPVLVSILMEYEQLLVNDGCTGIAVLNPRTPQEVQFDEHKLLIMYGNPLQEFERVLEQQNIVCQPSMRFVTESEHIHASNREYIRQFESLCNILGTDDEGGGALEA